MSVPCLFSLVNHASLPVSIPLRTPSTPKLSPRSHAQIIKGNRGVRVDATPLDLFDHVFSLVTIRS